MMKLLSTSVASRLCFSLMLAALLLACVIIEDVICLTEVSLGSEAEFILDLRVMEFEGTNLTPHQRSRYLWVCYLAIDVPNGWTIDSGYYEGVIGGDHVAGEGIVFDPPSAMDCESQWPKVPQGYVRRWIHTESHESSWGGTATAWVRFKVNGEPGEYRLAFHAQTEPGGDAWCSPSTYFQVNVSDISNFADGFESGDTSAWSNTVP